MAYFEVEFTHCHTYVGFSTSPYSKDTHWKQTFFFLDDYITAKKDEVINGIFHMKPSTENFRELNVEIDIDFKGEIGNYIEKSKYRVR